MSITQKYKNTQKLKREYKKYSLWFLLFVSISLTGFFVSSKAFAATGINKQVSFQGKVVNTNGTNVSNASYNFLFCIYTTASPASPCTAGSDNDAVWRESKSLTVTDGIFQTNLGDTTAFASLVDFNTDNIYLGINFNSDGQMSPLVRFTAAPYAMNAAKVGGLTVTDTTGTLTIPSGKTISFADAFSTSGAYPLTLTSTASTTATLPSGTITLVDLATSQSLTNKTIGSTGLTFSGAATDITTGTGESLVIVANGAGVVDIQDATTVDSLTTDTGGVSIAAGQSYTGAGAVTLSSTTNGLTLDSGNNTLTIAATDTALSATGVATLTLAPNVSITNASGNITLQPASSSTIAKVQIGAGGAGSTTPDFFALDVKSDTGDPAGGFEGAMYYNTLDNKFRCYQNTGWTDCIATSSSQTPWTSDINAAGYDLGSLSNLGFQETTGAPTGTDVGFYRDNSGDLTGNVLTGKTFNLAVNGTDEYNFSSTGLGMNSNDITGLGTNLTAAVGLTIATTTTGVLTLDSGTTGAVNIGTGTSGKAIHIGDDDTTADTLTVGSAKDSVTVRGTTITIGNAADTTVSITDNNWSVTAAGAATFTSVGAGSGTITTSGTIGTAATTTFTGAGGTFSSALAANGGITFDQTTDTIGAFTAGGTIDMNSNIIVNIGATTTDFTTSGSLAIGLDAADANGALMVDNVAQANPIIVAKDNGTMVWQVGDNGLISVDPATTGTVESIALATQWTTGTVISAAFGSSTTQSAGAMTGVALDFNTNLTAPAAGQNVTGLDVKLPVASTTSNATVYTGFNLSTAGAITNATAGSFAWRGANIAMPNITQSAGGTVTSSGVLITSGSITTAGTENMLSLSASGVGAGTLNAISVGTITGSTGAETAINVGSGWDTILGGTTAGTNLIGFSNFTVTTAGAGTFASTLNANGGIAFDASTDTVGAHTLSGTVDANANIITNIGNSGTDFVASTGALTLAGVLTANGGITLAGSQTFSASALSYMDLGAITQSSTANQGLRLPNAASATPSNPTSGEGYLAWDASGNQLITYNGSSWSTLSGGSGYNLIKDETTGLTARTTLAFLGAGVTCADGGSQTECTIAGGSGADLQGTYDTGSAGDQVIQLDATQDSIIVRNPASSGSSSAFTFKIDQLAGGAVDGLQISNAGTGNGLTIDATSTGSLAVFKKSGVGKVTFANNGALTINGTDSSIVRASTTDFALGTVGSKLVNSGDRVELADGTPANSGQGTITTTSQPATPTNIGAGAFSITRPNGKYMIVNGGGTGTTQIYDPFAPVATAITAGPTITCNLTTTIGVGALALPQANGLYTIICGTAGSTTTATSIVDPSGAIGSRIGPALLTAVTGAGTVAYKRPDGKYLVALGISTPAGTTAIFDPVANTLNTAGPSAASGAWSAGSLVLPMPDGRALFVNGGSTSTTNIYNPNGVSATIGTFTVGPSLDGVKAANTCGINNAGSVAMKRQDGKYVIMSKANVSALYDPSAVTMTCRTTSEIASLSNAAVLGDGAHAIPLQNGKFLIFAGGNTTTAYVYNQDTDTFSAYSGTAPTAITTGAHSLLLPDGTWQIITGTNSCTNGCTNNFDTALPMSDPFPATLSAAAPTSGGSCTAGTHSYFVSYIMAGSVESQLSDKSNIVSCTAGNGTVALSNIPIGPPGTGSRKVYRTTTGDASVPKLLTTIGDNSTTTYSDTTADGSLGADYSVTAATTWYTSEDISNSSLGIASTIRWTAQLEAAYAAMRNNVSNTAYKVIQIFVKTAVDNSGCATPLAAAQWQEIQNSGDSIRAVPGANCVKVSIHFNRALPKKLYDDRGTWMGNNSTILRLDYMSPTIFDYAIDNSAVFKRSSFDFVDVTNSTPMAPTVPIAPTSAAPSGSGSCTSGNHFWFVTFVINGAESNLSPASTVRSCSGSNLEPLTAIPIGPSGTTARKIYRTAAGYLVTDTPFLVTTISDNSTTTYDDALADSALGAAYAQLTPSGPTLSRAVGSRVETSNNQLTLPWGRITPTTLSTSGAGIGQAYMGQFGADHPTLTNTAGPGTFVIARDDKTFLVVEGGGATAELYDPATQTFINQSGTGNIPTATVGVGGFAIKRPNGKFLVILGNNSTTTNIYDQYAPPGSRFTAGPALTGTAAHQGAFAMQNADGTWTILPGNAAATTSIYDPVRNTMTVGPLQTTATNFGALAIPLQGPNANIYKVINGTTVGGAVALTTMNYNAITKIFTAGQNLAVGVGNGAMAFQRQDGYWVLLRGESAANTLGTTVGIINPVYGTEVAGTALAAAVNGRGTTVIPRADGTFLITSGNSMAMTTTPGSSVSTVIYFPWGGASGSYSGTPVAGFSAAGPAMPYQGTTAAVAALTTSAPASGGSNLCDTGTHYWRYTQVINGVETALSLGATVQTCTVTTLGQEALTNIAVGPAGTSDRKIYRTKAGTTSPYFLVATLSGNIATTYNDSASDASLGAQYWSGGPGDGAVSFQRPDGKFITIYAGASWTTPLTEIGSKMVSIYDAGWYADGQYLSEAMNVPAMAANSTLEWQQTSDQFVRMAARVASSQTALGVAEYIPISNPGGSLGNAGSETWAQVQVNFRRDFPTFGYNQNGVYLGSGGGLAYTYRTIAIPTVNSFQITNGMDLMSLQNNGLNVFRVTSNGSILSSTQGGFYSGGADLAENYTSTQMLAKGEVVMIDQANPEAVLRATGQYQNNIIGVVSTTPGFVAGGYTESSYPIALVGRVPVRVSTENGPIRAGDTLTSASISGYAMKATMAGRALGRALEAFDPANAVDCPSQGLGNDPATKCGSVMMFVNLANYYGEQMDVVMADRQSTGTAEASGLDTLVSSEENNGLLTPPSVRLAISPPTKSEEMLTFLEKLRDERRLGGAPSSEVLADRISATGEIIAPMIVTDTLFAKHIKADTIEGLQIFTDQISSLSEKYAGLQADLSAATENGATPETDAVMKALAIESAKVTLALQVLGKLDAEGGIVIGGDAEFNGPTLFNKLVTFVSETLFQGKVSFEKAPTFGSDTAGFAVIEKGATKVHIAFGEAYERQPIVTASLTNDRSPLLDDKADAALKADVALVEADFQATVFGGDIRFMVTEKGKDGFTIVLNKPAPYDLQFSWVAIAVTQSKTFTSEPVNEKTDLTSPVLGSTEVPVVPIPSVSEATASSTTGESKTVNPEATTGITGDTLTPLSSSESTLTEINNANNTTVTAAP